MADCIYTFGQSTESAPCYVVYVPAGTGLVIEFEMKQEADPEQAFDGQNYTWTLPASRRASGEPQPAWTLEADDGLDISGLDVGKVTATITASQAARSRGRREDRINPNAHLWLALRAVTGGQTPWLVATVELRVQSLGDEPKLTAAAPDAPLVIRIPLLVPEPAQAEVAPSATTLAPPPFAAADGGLKEGDESFVEGDESFTID